MVPVVSEMVPDVSGVVVFSGEDVFGPWQAQKSGIIKNKTLIADRFRRLQTGNSVYYSNEDRGYF
jgi:hypothetical protein